MENPKPKYSLVVKTKRKRKPGSKGYERNQKTGKVATLYRLDGNKGRILIREVTASSLKALSRILRSGVNRIPPEVELKKKGETIF